MIYLFLALTSWDVKLTENNNSQLSDFQKRLLLFVDGLYKGRNGEGLNGVKVVSEKTGIPEDECKELRDYLASLKINGELTAITVSQGVVNKNYSKREIVDYITTHNLFLS
jgi:sulfur carrier protein ThiS